MTRYYIIKIGELFIERSWYSINSIQLNALRNKAMKLDEKETKELKEFLSKNKVEFCIYEVNETFTERKLDFS